MRRFIFCTLLLVSVWNSSAASVVPGGLAASNTYAIGVSTARSSVAAIEIEQSPPTPSYYFWAHQFFLTARSDHNGYFGLQTNGLIGSRWVGKMVIFSIWNAIDAVAGPNATAQTFGGEGVGYSIRLPYEWEDDVEYRFSISKENELWWALRFQPSGGAEIYLGKIKITEDVVLHATSANFVEFFTSVDACKDLPYSRARFSPVRFDDIAYSASNERTYGNCVDNATASLDAASVIFETGIIERSAQMSAFVERFYTNILGRPSDQGGLKAWLNMIQTQSASAVALGFLNSSEFLNKNLDDAAFVDILYRTLFDRAGDTGGTSYWLEQLAAGKLRDMVIWGFLRAAEFKTLSDSFGVTALNAADESAYGIRAFVERFYTLVLGRQPDRGGFDNWVTALTNGSYAGGDIAKAFFLSAEYLNQNTSNDAFVDTCYQAFFGRAADSAGKEGWLKLLAQGQSREQVLNGFIGSTEFAALAASYGIKPSRLAANFAERAEAGLASEQRVQRIPDAEAIPALPIMALLIFSGLLGLFGVRRLTSR